MLIHHHWAETSPYGGGPWASTPDVDLPRPVLRAGLGQAHLPVTTDHPGAQAFFDQGLRLLHAGWGGEARRAFAEAARLDPRLALAHWGLALARGPGGQYTGERLEAIGRARALAPHASEREQRFVTAAAVLVEKGPANGRYAFVREMEALADRFPEETEARLLLAEFLLDGYEPDGRPGAGLPYAQALLRELLRERPEHEGVHHAWLHANAHGPRPHVALDSARSLHALAPESGPLLQTAGWLLRRLGRHAEARAVLEASLGADEAYLAREGLGPEATPSTLTTLRLLALGCADVGRYAEAQAWARALRTRVERAPQDALASALALSTQARLHLRFGFPRAAAALTLPHGGPEAGAAALGLQEAVTTYARALEALEAGRTADAARAADALGARAEALLHLPREPRGRLCPRDVGRVVELTARLLQGEVASRQGEHGRAEASLVHAHRREVALRRVEPPAFAPPALEARVHALLRAGQPERALEAAEALAARHPGRGHAQLLLGEVRAAAGDTSGAARALEAFLALWSHADERLPQPARARALLERLDEAAEAGGPSTH